MSLRQTRAQHPRLRTPNPGGFCGSVWPPLSVVGLGPAELKPGQRPRLARGWDCGLFQGSWKCPLCLVLAFPQAQVLQPKLVCFTGPSSEVSGIEESQATQELLTVSRSSQNEACTQPRSASLDPAGPLWGWSGRYLCAAPPFSMDQACGSSVWKVHGGIFFLFPFLACCFYNIRTGVGCSGWNWMVVPGDSE